MNENKAEYLLVVLNSAAALVDSGAIRVGESTITASRSVRYLGHG